MNKFYLIFFLSMALIGNAIADICTTNPGTGDQDCANGNYSYTIPSSNTLASEAADQVAENTPAAYFNVNTFIEKLSLTSLANDINISPYYGQFKDFLSFKNFQGAANFLTALFNAGKINQSEIDTIDNTLENQQINLASYNSEINESY